MVVKRRQMSPILIFKCMAISSSAIINGLANRMLNED